MQAMAPAPAGVHEDAATHNNFTSEKSLATSSVENPAEEWKAGRQEWLIMITLVVISLMAAIDATILVTALPVSNDSTSKI